MTTCPNCDAGDPTSVIGSCECEPERPTCTADHDPTMGCPLCYEPAHLNTDRRRHHTMTTTPTPILDNLRAYVVDAGTYDGGRGSTWTPAGSADYTEARLRHNSDTVQSIAVIWNGDAVRTGTARFYTPGLVVNFSRTWHAYNGDGTFISTRAHYLQLPDHATEVIGRAVAERVATVRSALGYGVTEYDGGAFLDAMFLEASRAGLAQEIDRKRADLDRLAATVADLEHRLCTGEAWNEYARR